MPDNVVVLVPLLMSIIILQFVLSVTQVQKVDLMYHQMKQYVVYFPLQILMLQSFNLKKMNLFMAVLLMSALLKHQKKDK
mmetsp:Transcript_17894/g.27648  ORF Transcript_17894/g.27648 Transcript_17894/m.27648 type:complete len:80 (-) Transcript_17894:974-1213(-)